MEQELNRVKLELRVLREDHRALEEEVRRLRRSIAGLPATTGSPRGQSEADFSASGIGSGTERRTAPSPSYSGLHTSHLAPIRLAGLAARRLRTILGCGSGAALLDNLVELPREIKILIRAVCGSSSKASTTKCTILHWSSGVGLVQRST